MYEEIIDKVAKSNGWSAITYPLDKERLGEYDVIECPKKHFGIRAKHNFLTMANNLVLDDRLESHLWNARMLPIDSESKNSISGGEYKVMLSDGRIVPAVGVSIIEQWNEVPTFCHWEIDRINLHSTDDEDNITVIGYARQLKPIGSYILRNKLLLR